MKNTPHWFRRNFTKHFPLLDCAECMSLLLIRLGKGCYIDIIKFDAELERNHGKIPDGVSTADFVMEYYGKEAVEWVQEAL